MNGAFACRAVLDYELFLAGSEYCLFVQCWQQLPSNQQTTIPPFRWMYMGIYYYDKFCNEIAVSVVCWAQKASQVQYNTQYLGYKCPVVLED